MKSFILVFIFISLVLGVSVVLNSSGAGEDVTKNKGENLLPMPTLQASPSAVSGSASKPPTVINRNKEYQAVLKTSAGDIVLELNAEETPITVNNFVYLARGGFYNRTVFHRVIKDFMIQGGDPKGDGTGGPGYKFDDEPFEGEYSRGVLAMANAGQNTNGSQFFIMHKDYPLPKRHVIFGKVIEGMEVVDKIAEAPVELNALGEPSKPASPVMINLAEIREK